MVVQYYDAFNTKLLERISETLKIKPEIAPDNLKVPNVVQPSMDVLDLLQPLDIKIATVVLSTTWAVILTVPSKHRYLLHAVYASRSTGDRDATTIGFADELDQKMVLYTQAATSTIWIYLSHPLPLPPRYMVEISGTGGSTDGNWTCCCAVQDLDIGSQ